MTIGEYFTQGLTSVFYNANDDTSANNQRKKRQAENDQTKNLYIAFESNGSETAKLRFTAVTSADQVSSPTTPSAPTTPVFNIIFYFIKIDIKPLTKNHGCFL